MENLQKVAKEIIQLISTNDKEKAVDKILAFKNDVNYDRVVLIRALISYAQENEFYELTRAALDAFEKIKAKAPKDINMYYDIANGYQTLFEMSIKNDRSKAFECQDSVEKAIKYFEKALTHHPRAFTNLGNLYDTIGRPIEAIDLYESALSIDKDFGMALGNKAYALKLLAPLSGHSDAYLIYAYQLYQTALSNKDSIQEYGGDASVVFFLKRSKNIFDYFKKNGKTKLLKKSLVHDHYDDKKLSKLVKFYIKFCLENNLYLNLHLSDKTADASIGDTMFPVLRTDIGKDEKQYVSDIAFRFNEICESFMTARIALVQSQYTNPDFSNISEQTSLVNNLDYSVSNIYVGHLKTAYKEVFSTLDKVAILLNHYLDLGHLEDNVYYHNVWFEPQLSGQTESKLSSKVKNEPALLGLYLLCQGLRGSKYSHLRNALTHRYIRIYKVINGPKGTYRFEDLTSLTLEVFYKVRCAIMYVSLFISRKERAKYSNRKGLISMPLYTDQNLDIWSID